MIWLKLYVVAMTLCFTALVGVGVLALANEVGLL